MASLSHSPVTFTGNLTSGTSASDLLRSSNNGVSGLPLKALGKGQSSTRRTDFCVSAMMRKVKKHEYPWPQDPDPNVKGGVLSHLSPFKPLKEKPKPVTLDFEKPLMDLQKKIIDIQKTANETGLDFTDQIISLENKYQQALKDLYTHLTPIQRVNIARHPNRPTFLDHVFNITEKFVELHGDRAGYDDPAIVTGLGTINGRRFMFMGHQKGRNTKENIQRNFGMPTPHGYRKALRMMYYADHHRFPIVTFIDTPGAFADLKSEELGQGEAIAHNLRTMFGLKVPIVSIVIGEGGSGGALAIGCANKLLMLENAVFYVASPEACAAILWKSAKAAPKAAEKLRITAGELCKLQIADGIIPEPLGGAHADPYWTSQQIRAAIIESMDELEKMDTKEVLKHRELKFRKIGGFQEGLPVDPIKKANMKQKEEPKPGIASNEELIAKLRREVDYEFSKAAKSTGLSDRIKILREEFAKSKNSNVEQIQQALLNDLETLKNELNENLSKAPNYSSLKFKLNLLKQVSEANALSDKVNKQIPVKDKINEKFKEVIGQPDLKQKILELEAEIQNLGVSSIEELDRGLKEKVLKVKETIETEFTKMLESSGLQVDHIGVNPSSFTDIKAKLDGLYKEIQETIEDIIESSELKIKIELLKIEVAKAGKNPSEELEKKIRDLEQEIKHSIAEALNSSTMKHKYDQLKAELGKTSGDTDGSVFKIPSYT